MATPLKPGDEFPSFTASTSEGRVIEVPRDLTGRYAVLLYYRGWW